MTEDALGSAAGSPATRLDHVALVVGSLERSTAFYTALFGLSPTGRVAMGDHRIAYLSSGTDVLLELIQYDDSDATCTTAGPKTVALRHTAWNVSDITALPDRVARLGGVVVSQPTAVPALGFTSMLIRDADGIEVEIVQRVQALDPDRPLAFGGVGA